jgi:hypothetical protein
MPFLGLTLQCVKLCLTKVCNLEGPRKLTRLAVGIIVPKDIPWIDVSMTTILFPVTRSESLTVVIKVVIASILRCRTCRAADIALFTVVRWDWWPMILS